MKAKNIYNPEELQFVEGYFTVSAADEITTSQKNEEENGDEEYTGPSIEEVKAEIEKLRGEWDSEYQGMLQSAKEQAKSILDSAKEQAKSITDSSTKAKDELMANAQKNVDMIIKNAQEQAQMILENAKTQAEVQKQDAREAGKQQGTEEGFLLGRAEADRMTERLGVIISSISRKRIEIIDELENQIIELVLQIVRKVVKVISENQESVVISNVDQALKKLRTKTDVTIRINLKDFDIVTAHKKDFIEKIENISNVALIEDASIEPGGCIVETDFGEIDARISSQLTEIEKKIIDLAPIRAKGVSYNFK